MMSGDARFGFIPDTATMRMISLPPSHMAAFVFRRPPPAIFIFPNPDESVKMISAPWLFSLCPIWKISCAVMNHRNRINLHLLYVCRFPFFPYTYPINFFTRELYPNNHLILY